ncbi:MAG: aspartyl protease family protein [Lewinellaceae bacterium]|nr:aspartyl protease family protein [Saprospiraceae bacterium]MCB9340261.1 aspartyl protease family protein [Lewinellaceae bacterium]
MKNAFTWLLLLLCQLALEAQAGFEILKDVKRIDIPFEYKNDLIIVNVTFGRIFPLKFIFDTGAEHTILSKREITDIMNVPYEREFQLVGSDLKTILTAYLVRGIHLRVGDMIIPNQSFLVLEEDYFRFEEMAGVEVQGILGADLFRGLVVKINYERRIITLMKTSSFDKPNKGYQALAIDVNRNKPYLNTIIRLQTDSAVQVKLLLDTGAMLSLLLNTDTHPDLRLPANALKGNIGAGLGGFLEGYLGRVTALQLGGLQCSEVLTNFQELAIGVDTAILYSRNGLIGNQILSRFNVIIDYPREQLYLQPNKMFNKAFEFDKSGLVLIASDLRLNKFTVHDVLPGSPAAQAGLLPGDEIRRLNLIPVGFLSLADIHRILKKKVGKKIRIVVKRGDKRLKFRFSLRKLI